MRRHPTFLSLLCLGPIAVLAACGVDTGGVGTGTPIATGSSTSAGGAGGGQSTTGGAGGLGGAGGSTTAAGGTGGAGGAGGSSTTATGGAGGAGGSSSGGAGGAGGAAICPTDGASCGEEDSGRVCAGGQCCEAGKACAGTCCGDAQICSFLQCVNPGNICYDASECPADSYCDYSLGDDPGIPDPLCQGGVQQANGKCLPKPPICAPGSEPKPGEPITCLTKCEYKPPAAPFSPVLKYSWGDWQAPATKDSVMMAPVIIQLDDDNCDGLVDERDIPEIVFSTFQGVDYNNNGTLHAISIVDGKVVEKWSVNTGGAPGIHPGRSIAAGNFDGQPGNEIAVCMTDGSVRAYKADGTVLWTSTTKGTCSMPSLADLDQDGTVEVIVESRILNGADGTPFLAAFNPPNSGNIVASDVDGDGKLDLVTPTRIYRLDGTVLAETGLGGSYVAVGDLDNMGLPEIIVADSANHALIVWRYDESQPNNALILRQGVDINGPLSPSLCAVGSAGNIRGGGPPTIADFDGDGFPDAALAGGVGYAVFSGAKTMDGSVANADTILWIKQTQDCSSAATGSSVFDFDGDGKAEVVYADEKNLHVYAGPDGTELFTTCNTNGTLYEYPLVADVDNDGQADLIVGSNSYSGFKCDDNTKTSGIRVFGDEHGAWVRTRRVWNQHPYHVTNVDEDGTIPTVEAPNYLQPRLNNFRQNVQPLGEFSAPDLVVSIFPSCADPYGLVARVRNVGEASAVAGIPVGFYLGDPNNGGLLLGQGVTTKVLYSVESEDVVLELPNPPQAVTDGTGDLYAVVADGPVPQTFHECRTDNNQSEAGHGACHD